MPLTKEQIERYLKLDSGSCPYCWSKDIEGQGSCQIDGDGASQEVYCNGCGRIWHDDYALIGITEGRI